MTELLLRLLAELARRARRGDDEAMESLARVLGVSTEQAREALAELEGQPPTVGDDETPA